MKGVRVMALLMLLLASQPAWPHAGSNAFLFVDARDDRFDTRLDLATRDLDEILSLDADGDGRITWIEVETARAAIERYARGHLRFDGCTPTVASVPLQAVEHTDGWYVVVHLEDRCRAGSPVSLEWSGVFDIDASHRAQVRLQRGPDVRAALLTPSNRSIAITATGSPQASGVTVARYFVEGMVHVLTGLDHLLFLAGLFLPVALVRTARGWAPVLSRRVAFARAALIVTAFTAAHAFSLCLVALGTIHPPTRLVESLVAFSVAFAGFNNLVPLFAQRRLALLAAGFGLIHGAAIGSALLDLGLPVGARVMALAAFNIGVECAQLLPVTVAVLATFTFRASPLYRRAVLVPGSIVVTIAGLVWLVWRAFALPAWVA